MTPFGFQLYTARDVPSLAAFLPRLSALGFTHVEGFGGAYAQPQAMRTAMDAAKLTMPTGHFGLADLRDDFDSCADTARLLGVHTIVAPYLDANERPVDAAGYTELARRLTVLNTRCADAGFGFAWHNHDFELAPLSDGSVGLDVLLNAAPDILWEADLAWVARGGADPLAWVDAFGSRITAVHVKDVAPPGENIEQDGWTDLGAGTVDWPALIAQVRDKAGEVHWIAEHDKPDDPRSFAERAIATFRAWTD